MYSLFCDKWSREIAGPVPFLVPFYDKFFPAGFSSPPRAGVYTKAFIFSRPSFLILLLLNSALCLPARSPVSSRRRFAIHFRDSPDMFPN
jgi:hypothetical protein